MLRCLSVFLVCACALVAAGRSPAEDPKGQKPEAALSGVWILSSLEVDGQKLSDEAIANSTITVKDGKYTYKVQNQTEEEGTFKVDGSKKPPTMDLDIQTGKSQGKRQLGIYELDGKTWKLCVAEAGEELRPKEFHAKEGSKQLLFIFKKKP